MRPNSIPPAFLPWLIALLFGASAAHGQQTMSVDDLRPGMRAVGLTVFKGSEIERFDAEILGVLHKVRTQGDLIIARLSGGPLLETGVIAGMSGSPVYVSNRLIGAVAFSWTFSKEPIAGITPIADMMTTLDHLPPTNDFPNPDFFRAPAPGPRSGSAQAQEHYAYSGGELRRVLTPLVFSGVDDDLFETMKGDFEALAFMPVMGGAGDASAAPPGGTSAAATNPFRPGAAVAIRLVTGDVNISGVGTVTWVDGKRMLIFGHPMFQRGSCSFPVALADIVTVCPGYSSSFKIATAGGIVGRTVQDRQFAVSCETGPAPEMLPVTVRQIYRGRTRVYSYRIIDDYLYLQNFLAVCVINSVLHDKSPNEKNSFSIRMAVRLNDGRSVRLSNLYSELTTAQNLTESFADLSRAVMSIVLNPFRSVAIENIDVEIEQSDRIHIASIHDLRLKTPGEIHPGDPVELAIGLEPYQGGSWTTNVRVTIPASLPEGPLTLYATSSPEERTTDALLSADALKPRTYEQFIDDLENQPKNNEIVLWGIVRAPGLVIRGEEFHDLPRSRLGVLSGSREDAVDPMIVKFKIRIPTPYNVYEMRKITIPVKNSRFWR